ncbi:MAG: alcohol dehydrogenase catalytic domain-containing protein [Crenarchaeota archaeon]|nr:alcohol dehydrogenase catalytic domain-containing protein [Thermoproteota archaeon]
MLACVLRRPREVEVCRVPMPKVPRGWVLVKVRYVGICGTDIAMYRGSYPPRKLPIIPGHEIVGIVEDVGPDVPREIIGRKVVPEINIVCGSCIFCKLGQYTHCINRRAIGIDVDGGMAEYVAVPYSNLHIVDDVDDLDAVLIEPAAAALHAAYSIPRSAGWRCVIIGQGPLAYISALIFEKLGYDVTVIVKGGHRAELFRRRFKTLSLEEVDKYFKNVEERPDIVIEASGSPSGAELALSIVRPGGVVIAKSTHGLNVNINYTRLVVNEVSLIGSRCGTFREWEHIITLLRKKELRLNECITHVIDLESSPEAFKIAEERRGLKVIVRCH